LNAWSSNSRAIDIMTPSEQGDEDEVGDAVIAAISLTFSGD
jgi:hypothetical protein